MFTKYLLLFLSFFVSAALTLASDIDLKKELTPGLTNKEVEIRAYKHQDGATITEHRIHGQVYMIKVQPVGDFPPYYLYDNEGNGNFERRIAGNKVPVPPMWIIKRS